MKPPKISIVIPSFNKVKYIAGTLDSIFEQKYPNFEVIVQDGRSTDGTLEIIKKYAKKYKELKWESKKDKGQLDAINKGLKKTKGDIITFINADDLYRKNAFVEVAKVFNNNPEAIWFAGRGSVIDCKGREIAKSVVWYKNFLLSLNSRFYLLITNYLMQPSVFFTKKAYKKYGPLTGNKNFVTEYDFWLKLSDIQMPIVVDKYLSKFRIEKSTKTKKMSGNLLNEDRKVVAKYTKNPLILFLHDLNNLGRVIVNNFV